MVEKYPDQMNKGTKEQRNKKEYKNAFKEKLKKLMDEYVQFIYQITKKFPKEEIYGVTSQTRRATLSIILNYIEGFARRKSAVQLNFFETSYGSLKESRYLVYFAYKQQWITNGEYDEGLQRSEETGAMLWTDIEQVERRINKK